MPTAAEKILQKQLVTTGLYSSELDGVTAALKDRAFFSARVESVRFLQTAQSRMADLLSAARNADGALTSRAQIVSDLMRTARETGIATGKGGVSDPGSSKRAQVIVDTNAGLSRGYADYAAGASFGARLAYPAQELVRVEPRKNPRADWPQRWQAAGGKIFDGRMVALKSDPACSKVSRFGVPYGPPDYGSGMGWRDVSFEDAVAIGLITDGYRPSDEPLADFNATLEAELDFKGDNDPAWQWLKESFGDQIKHSDGKVRWQGDIVGDAFRARASDPSAKRSVRLGVPTPEAIEAAPAGSPIAGKNLAMQSDHLYHELTRHIGAAETHANAVPLAEADLSLIPHVWRRPDRVIPDPKTGALFFELKSADGNWYRLIVEPFRADTKFRTFYKVKAGASGLPVPG